MSAEQWSRETGSASVGVLICDDNGSLRLALRAVIGSRPSLRVLGEAADGNEAIAEARRLQPDVILLDLAMPQLTGLEALGELRRIAPEAKIIVFSSFADASVAQDVIELGAVRYMEKGGDIEELNDAIEEAAAAKTRSRAPTRAPG